MFGGHWSQDNNFYFLTIAQVGYVFLAACLDQFWQGDGMLYLQAGMAVILAIGVWSIKKERLWFATGIGFIISTTALAVLGYWIHDEGMRNIYQLLIIGYLVATSMVALKQVLFSGRITTNNFVGAICIYLLIGLSWANLYMVIANVFPGAFNGLPQQSAHNELADFIYYSFITLTTIGYGEITPVLPLARFFAYMQAIVGQFYMAILVASLVGAGLSNMDKKR